jgi:hypothetical protein
MTMTSVEWVGVAGVDGDHGEVVAGHLEEELDIDCGVDDAEEVGLVERHLHFVDTGT